MGGRCRVVGVRGGGGVGGVVVVVVVRGGGGGDGGVVVVVVGEIIGGGGGVGGLWNSRGRRSGRAEGRMRWERRGKMVGG